MEVILHKEESSKYIQNKKNYYQSHHFEVIVAQFWVDFVKNGMFRNLYIFETNGSFMRPAGFVRFGKFFRQKMVNSNYTHFSYKSSV